jgi:hypothetical protein
MEPLEEKTWIEINKNTFESYDIYKDLATSGYGKSYLDSLNRRMANVWKPKIPTLNESKLKEIKP